MDKQVKAHQWRQTLEEWRQRRAKSALAPEGTGFKSFQEEKQKGEKRLGDMESQVRLAAQEIERLKAECKKFEEEAARAKQETARWEAAAIQADKQLEQLRQDYGRQTLMMQKEAAAREAAEAKRIEEMEERVLEMQSRLQQKEAALQAAQQHYQDSVARIQSLLSQLDEKNQQMERLSLELGRYQSAEIHQNLTQRIHELENQKTKLETDLQSQQKELSDFKTFLASREKDLTHELERQSSIHAKTVEALEDALRQKQAHVEELEAEITSFRKLLQREEERNRRQEASIHALEENRQLLLGKLKELGADIQDYQAKLARHFSPAQEEKKGQPPFLMGNKRDSSLAALAAEFALEEGGYAGDPAMEVEADLSTHAEDLTIEAGEEEETF